MNNVCPNDKCANRSSVYRIADGLFICTSCMTVWSDCFSKVGVVNTKQAKREVFGGSFIRTRRGKDK